jgi:hypothetical protein
MVVCQSCGVEVGAGTQRCESCGHERHPPGATREAELLGRIRASSGDAWSALAVLATDPISGLAKAYARLSPERAMDAGFALCGISALAATIGVSLGARRFLGGWFSMLGGARPGVWIKLLLAIVIAVMALASGSYGLRRLLGAGRGASVDVFTAGVATMPWGIAMMLAGLLGTANLEIAGLLTVGALSYLVLVLYAGLTGIGSVVPRAAGPAVPALILLAAWTAKVALVALL